MTIPVYEQCIDILEKVDMPEDVMKHVELVAAMAVAFAESINRKQPNTVDVGLARAGGLLHDLGRARTHTTTWPWCCNPCRKRAGKPG